MQRETRPAGRQTLARLLPLFGVALLALTSVACSPPNAERPQTKKFVPRAEVQTREHAQGANSGLSPLGLEPESRCENIERPNPERWSKEVDRYLEEDDKQFPEPGRVVFVGSSSIRLWTSLETDMAPVPTLRRGLGGAIIRDTIYYADTLIAPYEPGAVVLYAGDNDIAAGIPPACVLSDVKRFVQRTRELGVTGPIYYVGIKPSPSREALWPKMQEANEAIRKFMSEDDSLHFVDISQSMRLENGTLNPVFFQSDRLHMTEEGYRAWTDRLKPALLRRS